MFSRILFAIIICYCIIVSPLEAVDTDSLLPYLNIPGLPTISNNLASSPTAKKLCPMTTDQLIEHYGYVAQNFTVVTEDGYILTLFRCFSKTAYSKKRRPILLVHGMMDSSDTFSMNPGNQSLAYFLADRGYDVFLYNARGNRYSRAHKTHNPNKSGAFWNFSWYEMGHYDLPATIDTILNTTGHSNITCVGHSQGGTAVMVLLSTRPEYNKKVTFAALMAPFIYMNQVGFPVSVVLKSSLLFSIYKNWEFVKNSLPQRIIAQTICKIYNGSVCSYVINFALGPSQNQINQEMLPVYMCHFPAGSSVNQLLHFAQEFRHKYFGKMMTGFLSKKPEEFPIEKVSTALGVFYSTKDPHTPFIDIETLQSKLPNVEDLYMQEINQFNHVDFVWGINACEYLYPRIVELDEQHS